MSESVSRDEFLRRLVEISVLSTDELRVALSELDGDRQLESASAVAGRLVSSGRLTPFQAEALLHRRGEDLRLGNYIVLDRLGSGGMGTVYKARHRRMNRVVALKTLTVDAARQSSFVRRFEREVQTIAQLNHPNIVMAYDADESGSTPFLVMEFVNGQDLGTEVEKGGPLSVAAAVDTILQAAEGLAYAHGQGLVHRDIKPANLLRDTSGTVKVADLGLARFHDLDPSAGSSLTQVGGFVGSAAYAPPEQALDATSVDPRADVYALGCTLFFLLTGRSLYASRSLMGLLLMHREAPIPSLRDLRADAPVELDQVYRRMVAKLIDERYPTINSVIAELEAIRKAKKLSDVRPEPPRQPKGTAGPLDVTVADESRSNREVADPRLGEASLLDQAPTLSALRRLADLTVVLVEPSRVQTNLVRRYLQQLGIEKIYCTGSGKQAMELAKREGADCFLSAMHLTDMTGSQLAQALSADPGCSCVGFVLTSSESDGGAANGSIEAPRALLLPKPYNIEQLAQSLARATGCEPSGILPSHS